MKTTKEGVSFLEGSDLKTSPMIETCGVTGCGELANYTIPTKDIYRINVCGLHKEVVERAVR